MDILLKIGQHVFFYSVNDTPISVDSCESVYFVSFVKGKILN